MLVLTPLYGLNTPEGRLDHGPEIIFDQHLPQGLVAVLALEDDAFGHDDARASAGVEMFGDVIHEEHFTALGLDRKPVVLPDAAFG